MGNWISLTILAAAFAAAFGQEAKAQAQTEAQDAPRPWELTLSGGTGFFDTPAPYLGLALSRQLGNSFVNGRISYSSEAQNAKPNARINLPSRAIGGGLGFGHRIGNFTGEVHGFYAARRGDPITSEINAPRTNARTAVTTEPQGRSLSFGGSLSADFGQNLVFTPFVAGDWSSIRTNQVLAIAGRTLGNLVSQTESGVSGAFGLDVSAPLGPKERFWLGLGASANGATNGAAADFAGSRLQFTGLSQGLNSEGQDGWGEFSGHASLALTAASTFTLSGTRSVGVAGGDATSVGAALSWRF